MKKVIRGKLTKKQQLFYERIEKYFNERGETPTASELKEMTGAKSFRTITQYLDTLEKKGLIYRRPNRKRGIELVNMLPTSENLSVSLPVVASAGCDNACVFADERIDEYVAVDKSFIPSGKKIADVVVVKAVGNSMKEADIENGDYVLVEKLEPGQAKENDRVVAVIDDRLVIKKIHFADKAVVLNPESKSKAYKSIIMQKDFPIPGRVIDVIRMKPEEPELRYEKVEDNQ